ncbi:MAG: hypothetical protein FAZ92_01317 [Accumulibacter sp.]|nr:MAG: hypothetical protein FAZ92_01317 [Accumulibacter sp.]
MIAFDRSTLCLPRLSDSASRSVASETKPSATSSLPIGRLDFICSSSAMRSWSSLRMPLVIRIWPSGRACGCPAGAFMTVAADSPAAASAACATPQGCSSRIRCLTALRSKAARLESAALSAMR